MGILNDASVPEASSHGSESVETRRKSELSNYWSERDMMLSASGQSFTQEGVVIGMALMLALVFAVAVPGFASWGNAMALLRSISVIGVLALGMTVVIIGGSIDLSQIAVAL